MKTKRIIRLLVLFLMICASVVPSFGQTPKKNIVLIMADDFNYWNGISNYYPGIKTPNLDKLATRGVLFADAQAAAPVCNPSRQAMWSGFRPSTSGIEGNSAPWIRATAPFQNVVTMNQYFKDNGYFAWGVGKLYHSKFGEVAKTNDDDNWSASSASPIGGSSGPVDARYYQATAPDDEYKWSVNPAKMTTSNCRDFNVATQTAAIINGYAASANKNKPFFVACGVSKPHLPFDAPLEFYNNYVTANMLPPAGYRANDLNDTTEGTDGVYTKITTADKWKDAIQMYAACLSLADFNAGVIIDAVENSIYKDNTIIVFVGDHGWHLGEKNRFGKASPWDMANKTTLIIYDPSYKNVSTTPKICTKVVSMQDIYPTLVELSGLPIKTDIEGNSIAALIENPAKADWDKPVAVTRIFDRIRTNKWSYCDMDGDGGANPTTSDMLYDIENDPNEFVNMLHSSYTGMPRADVLKIRTRLVAQLDSIKNIGFNMKSKLLANYKFTPKSLTIPGTIEAEDYDEGGYEQTYFDADKVNSGGQYRTADGTDIFITDDASGAFHLGGFSTGDWCNYTVKDYLKGGYNVDFRVRNSGATPAVLQIYNRDQLLTELTIPGSTTSWQTIRAAQIELADQYSTRLRVKVKSGSGVEFNSMKFEMVNLSNPQITANISRKCLVSTIITDGVLYLDLQSSDVITSVAIYDLSGKLVSSSNVAGEQMVAYTPKAPLAPGIYFLRVQDDNEASVEKFIVK